MDYETKLGIFLIVLLIGGYYWYHHCKSQKYNSDIIHPASIRSCRSNFFLTL